MRRPAAAAESNQARFAAATTPRYLDSNTQGESLQLPRNPRQFLLCLDSKTGGENLICSARSKRQQLCLDSKTGGENLGRTIVLQALMLCLDSKTGGENLDLLPGIHFQTVATEI
jgi:hypothetical protein